MAGRKPARYLAPLALLAVVAAIVVLVRDQQSPPSHASRVNVTSTSLTQSARRPTSTHRRGPAVYVVKSGDTLSGISVKTGVSIATLESLNPQVNPNALQTGQQVKLRR